MEGPMHLLCFVVFGATLYHNVANIFIDGVTNSYGGRFKFLTFINLIISCLYYGLAIVSDVWTLFQSSERGKHEPVLKKWRDDIFGAIIFPLSGVVTLTFWGVMAVNSELMLPENLRHMIPVHGYYNHCAHTAPQLSSLLQLFFVKRNGFPSRKRGILGFTLFCVGYVIWILWIAYRADIWVYPVLKVLSWPSRIVFLGSVYLLGVLLFLTGHKINAKQQEADSSKLQ